MSRRSRVALLLVSVLLGTGLVARSTLAQLAVSFRPPHVVRASAATLAPELSKSVDARIREDALGSVDEVLRHSLDATGARLHFGLAHRTSLGFGAEEREGNCIEYAHLFAAIFNRAVKKERVAARAYVVHSEDARVFGERIGVPGLGEHDWVVVVAGGSTPRKLFVDPTLYDAGLGWDIAASVHGDVRAP